MSLDKAFIARIAADRGWDHEAILERYKFGIEWPMVRAVLRSKTLRPTARRALQVAQAGGFWSDERRWMCGLKEDPGCGTCHEAVGDDEHYFGVQCPAVQIEMTWRRIAGEPHTTPCTYAHPDLAPLNYLGLPPRWRPWKPADEAPVEGWLSMGPDSTTYGDGSGYRQQIREARIATWSVIRLRELPSGQLVRAEALRGTVAGLFPTVPRAEMTALLQHLRHAGPAAAYGGDCQHVLDTARNGVAPYYTSSKCINADLWQAIRAALEDHGMPMTMKKIKAHATQSAAIANGTLAEDWLGNHLADQHCKTLAKNMANAQEGTDIEAETRQAYRRTIDHITAVAAWAFRYRPQYAKGGRTRKAKHKKASEEKHTIMAMKNGKWRCNSCRREAWSRLALARLERTNCCGHIVGDCHQSHALVASNGILWCRSCGAYTTRQPRSLRFPCTGRPRSEAAFNVRARLMRGLPPTTASYLKGASITNPGPYFSPNRRLTEEPGDAETKDNARRSDADGRPGPHPHTCSRTRADAQAEDSRDPQDDEQQRLPLTARRRIRGKSTPPSLSAAADASTMADRTRNMVEHRGHDVAERTARARYRQLDLRTASTEKVSGGADAVATACNVKSPRTARKAPRPPMAHHHHHHHCFPEANAPWIHRLTIVRSSAAVECTICHASCRGRCTGCGAPCCVACARGRRPCVGTAHRHLHPPTGRARDSGDNAANLTPTANNGHPAALGEDSGRHGSHHHVIGGAAPQRADPVAERTIAVRSASLAEVCDSMSHPPHMRDHTGTTAGVAVACALPATCSVSSSSQGAAAVVDNDHGAQPCHGVPQGADGFCP